MRLRHIFLSLLLAGSSSFAATNDFPNYEEVYKLLHDNLSGVSESDLNRAAVIGLLNQLQPKVSIANVAPESGEAPALSQSTIYDNAFDYFRIGRVEGDLSGQFTSRLGQLSSTNSTPVKGIVLDLRSASGTDYAAAAALANQFINADKQILDWGTGTARSTQKTNAISVPVAVLVNGKTSGAAEALAAVLRDANVGLVLGSTTAGQASVYKEFTLSNGSKLRIATAPLKLSGDKVLSQGVTPDISINVSSEDEASYLKNPYAVLHPVETASTMDTNSAAAFASRNRRRFNEAELVRQQREGADPEDVQGRPRKDESTRPLINDPVLARALDLLKGLAVVEQGMAGAKGH